MFKNALKTSTYLPWIVYYKTKNKSKFSLFQSTLGCYNNQYIEYIIFCEKTVNCLSLLIKLMMCNIERVSKFASIGSKWGVLDEKVFFTR
jgi:hypothetical protein